MSTYTRCNNMWEDVLAGLEFAHPDIFDRVVDWYPSGCMEITIKLDDGVKMGYVLMDDLLFVIHDPKEQSYEVDDDDWRANFSRRLRSRMHRFAISQEELSDRTGISRVTISKYMNGKASPSGDNIERLVRALHCSYNELMNMR